MSDLKYRADIDGLRALAVVPVCFFHAGFQVFPGGFAGVSVFFVISGYLMASMIGQGLSRGDFTLAGFYERRVRRIFPALFLVLFFCTAVAAAVVPPRLFRDFGESLVATILFVSNVLFWRKTGNYFEAPTEWNSLLHTWSLAVEEQFYILFPLYLVLIWRSGPPWRFAITALAAAISLIASIWGTEHAVTATFYLLPTRAWELLLGALVALWPGSGAPAGPATARTSWIAAGGGLLGLAMIAGSLLWFDREMVFPGAAALVPTVGAALLIHFGRDERNPAARALGFGPVVFVGQISYSLYLWHWPLIVFVDKYKAFGETGPYYRAAALALASAAAYLSWRWVEQPFRKRSFAGRPNSLYGSAAVCIAALGLIGAFAQFNDGWPARFPGIASVSLARQHAEEQASAPLPAPDSCRVHVYPAQDQETERCFLAGGAGPKANTLLWGDSFALSYTHGLLRAEGLRLNILQYALPLCPPIIGYETAFLPSCVVFNKKVGEIIKRYRIATVIVVADWHVYIGRRKVSHEDIRRTLAFLRNLGVRPILVGQSPVFPFVYPDEYFFKQFGTEQTERAYWAPMDLDPGINRQLAQLAVGHTFFDPLALFCQGKNCVFKQGKYYLFTDYGHFSDYGSRKAAQALLDAIDGKPAGGDHAARR